MISVSVPAAIGGNDNEIMPPSSGKSSRLHRDVAPMSDVGERRRHTCDPADGSSKKEELRRISGWIYVMPSIELLADSEHG